MTGQRVGYKRVSTTDQNTARQLDGLTLDKMFEDKASGKDTLRPQLQPALAYCREGDTLLVHSMDRLARSLIDLRKMVGDLTARGIAVERCEVCGDRHRTREIRYRAVGLGKVHRARARIHPG